MSDESRGSRLPPPAFPPGARKHVDRRTVKESTPTTGAGEGFISPDDPMPRRGDAVSGAFISPDEPIPERDHALDDALISPDDPLPLHVDAAGDDDSEEGVVTGMDFDEHVEMEDLIAAGDPHLMEVMTIVSKLAESLKVKGEAGLRITPEMGRFEATLRGYCVGYVAGRRAEDEDGGGY